MGGVFWIKRALVNQHIMPDFSKKPLNNDTELNEWLYFYNMSTPLVGVGTFVTGNYVINTFFLFDNCFIYCYRAFQSLDLRLQHFHTYSDHHLGGHYHTDESPNTVEYLGYFSPGDTVFRVDQPPTHRGFGRDK